MGEPRGRLYILDLNQPAIPYLNYSPPPHYSYQKPPSPSSSSPCIPHLNYPPPPSNQQPPFVAQLEGIAVATESEASTDTMAASKTKTVQEPTTQNGSYLSTIKKALKRTLSKLSTITKDAPAV